MNVDQLTRLRDAAAALNAAAAAHPDEVDVDELRRGCAELGDALDCLEAWPLWCLRCGRPLPRGLSLLDGSTVCVPCGRYPWDAA